VKNKEIVKNLDSNCSRCPDLACIVFKTATAYGKAFVNVIFL